MGLTLACPAALPTDRCVILPTMDHLEVLREKIEGLAFALYYNPDKTDMN
jgi:hypothetical protein